MDAFLTDKIAWVTGGSRGIGRAIAMRLAKLGAKVAICARKPESMNATLQDLRRISPSVLGITADVSQSRDISRCVQEIKKHWGSVDILVNNAGIYRAASVTDTSTEEWDSQFAINLKAPFLATHAVVPDMIEKKAGTILFISSMVAVQSYAKHSCYTATKWGMDGFAGSIAQELVDYGIKVHVIRPGFTDTSIFDDMGGKPNLDVDWIHPDEIAGAVEFLLRLPKHAQIPELNYTTTAHRKSY